MATLTRGMAAGDETAYRQFHDAYFDRLSRYLLVVSAGNEDAMREALQATFVRVVRHVRVFADEAAFWSWLTVLARSAFADERRRRRRYLAFLDRFTAHSRTEQELARSDEADEPLRKILERSVASLPDDERRLVEQKYFQRQSVREIAAAFQTTEKAVESRLTRIRRKVKDAVLAGLKRTAAEP